MITEPPPKDPEQADRTVKYWWCGTIDCFSWHKTKKKALQCPKRKRALRSSSE